MAPAWKGKAGSTLGAFTLSVIHSIDHMGESSEGTWLRSRIARLLHRPRQSSPFEPVSMSAYRSNDQLMLTVAQFFPEIDDVLINRSRLER